VVFGLIVAVTGGFTTTINITLELSALEGFWLALALPAVLLVLGLIASPLSYLVFRAITMKKLETEASGG